MEIMAALQAPKAELHSGFTMLQAWLKHIISSNKISDFLQQEVPKMEYAVILTQNP